MALSFGSSLATKVYLGATEINLAYFGATQVYSSAAFSAEAQNYFSRLDAAGDTTYVDYKQPLANYIDGLVALGGAYWDTMVSAASFVGVGIQGVTVPLRAGMPALSNTNNNFVAGDLDQLTGLKGDGSTKYINANVTDSDTSQDDVSMSCWVSTGTVVNNAVFMGTTRTGMQSTTADFAPKIKSRSTSSNQVNVSPTLVRNFFGHTRTNSTDFDYSINGASGTATRTSIASVAEDVGLFNTGSPTGVYSDSRLATYHYGPALNLATLEALQDTLITEIAAVWNTVIYQSNFGVDTSGWSGVRGSLTANVDGIGSKDDNLEFIPDTALQSHYFRLATSNMNTVDTYRIQCEVYVPSANVIVDGFAIRDWTSGIAYSDYTAARDTWLQIDLISKFDVNGQPAFWPNAGGNSNFTGNGTDAIYIRNFTAKITS